MSTGFENRFRQHDDPYPARWTIGFKTRLPTPYEGRTDGFEDMVLEMARSGSGHEAAARMMKSSHGTGHGADSVTDMTECFEEETKAFKERESDGRYFAIHPDGACIPIGRKAIEEERATVALGIGENGSEEVLGHSIRPVGSLSACEGSLLDPKLRGLGSNGLFVSDGFAGLDELVKRTFPESRFRRCSAHIPRSTSSKARPEGRSGISGDSKTIKSSESEKGALEKLGGFPLKRDRRCKGSKLWSPSQNELLAFMDHPFELGRCLYSTNMMESLNKEIRRRVKPGMTSGENSLERDLACVLANCNAASRRMRNYDLIDLENVGQSHMGSAGKSTLNFVLSLAEIYGY